MKIREGYVISEIADGAVAIYTGEDEKNGLHGVVTLNRLGIFLWERLTEGCTKDELVKAVTDKYEIDENTAAKDIEAFLNTLRVEKIIIE